MSSSKCTCRFFAVCTYCIEKNKAKREKEAANGGGR